MERVNRYFCAEGFFHGAREAHWLGVHLLHPIVSWVLKSPEH